VLQNELESRLNRRFLQQLEGATSLTLNRQLRTLFIGSILEMTRGIIVENIFHQD
jgi:hypothetical protein